LGNLNHLTNKDEIKFVIGNRQDYDFAKGIIASAKLDIKPLRSLHFSPVLGRLEPQTLAQWLLEDHLPVRLHLQLHKLIWAPEQRGV
jgi:7-carboxy-7-deazaguanine synthase